MKKPLEIEIELFNKQESDLLGIEDWEAKGERVRQLIDLDEIESVRETMEDDAVANDRCCIYFKSGESVICFSHGYDDIKSMFVGDGEMVKYNPNNTTISS